MIRDLARKHTLVSYEDGRCSILCRNTDTEDGGDLTSATFSEIASDHEFKDCAICGMKLDVIADIRLYEIT